MRSILIKKHKKNTARNNIFLYIILVESIFGIIYIISLDFRLNIAIIDKKTVFEQA